VKWKPLQNSFRANLKIKKVQQSIIDVISVKILEFLKFSIWKVRILHVDLARISITEDFIFDGFSNSIHGAFSVVFFVIAPLNFEFFIHSCN